jgi:hypothetical protein
MKLHGHAKLILTNNETGWVEKVVEKDNTITSFPSWVANEGNFQWCVPQTQLMPFYNNFFGGCLLTNKINEYTLATGMLDGDSLITAQASNDVYNYTENLKRGSKLADEWKRITSPSTNLLTGYRFGWEWGSSQGNGNIQSICLCPPQFARAELSTTAIPVVDSSISAKNPCVMNNLFREYTINDNTSATYNPQRNFCLLSVIDYENGVGYRVTYSSGVIKVYEYIVSTLKAHIVQPRFTCESTTGGEGDCIAVHTYSQTLNNYALSRVSVSYNGKLNIMTWYNFTESGTYKCRVDCVTIDPANWDNAPVTKTHTYNNIQITETDYWHGGNNNMKDVILIIGTDIYTLGYEYVGSSATRKMLKMSYFAENPAQVEAIDLPTCYLNDSVASYYELQSTSVLLPNGDFYKLNHGIIRTDGQLPSLYYHNGVCYAVLTRAIGAYYSAEASSNYTGYGTIISTSISDALSRACVTVSDIFPSVSSVVNLEEPLLKKPAFSMHLIYEITEQAT